LNYFCRNLDIMTIDQIRQNLIDKILLLDKKEILLAMDTLLAKCVRDEDIYQVTEGQRKILLASEEDIKYNRLYSDEDVNNDEDKWLNQ